MALRNPAVIHFLSFARFLDSIFIGKDSIKVIQCSVFVLCSIYWFPVCFVQFVFEFLLVVLAKYPDHRSAVCVFRVLFDYSKVGQVICYVTVYVAGAYFFRYCYNVSVYYYVVYN